MSPQNMFECLLETGYHVEKKAGCFERSRMTHLHPVEQQVIEQQLDGCEAVSHHLETTSVFLSHSAELEQLPGYRCWTTVL